MLPWCTLYIKVLSRKQFRGKMVRWKCALRTYVRGSWGIPLLKHIWHISFKASHARNCISSTLQGILSLLPSAQHVIDSLWRTSGTMNVWQNIEIRLTQQSITMDHLSFFDLSSVCICHPTANVVFGRTGFFAVAGVCFPLHHLFGCSFQFESNLYIIVVEIVGVCTWVWEVR